MNTERLDWDTLRVFRVVAELGSMSGAAARLGESSDHQPQDRRS